MKLFVDPEGPGAAAGVGAMIKPSMPRALDIREIQTVMQDFARAARNALAAGFDGVELHAGNGYLLEQFLDPHSNRRDDSYGGTPGNRLRFLCEMPPTELLGLPWPRGLAFRGRGANGQPDPLLRSQTQGTD